MELGYWISIGVAALSFLTTIIGFVVNVVKELKFKKLEQKIGLYLRYISSLFSNNLNNQEQKEIIYKMLLAGSDDVVNILKEIHFSSIELDAKSKPDFNRKLMIAMRAEFTSKRRAKILASFPDKAFK